MKAKVKQLESVVRNASQTGVLNSQNEISKEMGSRLKKMRCEANFTQEQVASILQVTSRILRRWENGYTGIKLRHMVQLMKLYGYEFEAKIGVSENQDSMVVYIYRSLRTNERIEVTATR